jgi:hypothetical protein
MENEIKIKDFLIQKLGKTITVKVGEIQIPECITWTEQHIEIIDEIIDNYDVNIGAIKITKDYQLIDGNHRVCILWEKYGDDHEIIVKQIPINRRPFYTILVLLLPILMPIGLILKTRQLIFKNKK